MIRAREPLFVETAEYRRFAEFCDACRRFRYIGLCYGPPGVGKTLSARHYALWDKVLAWKSSGQVPKSLMEEACRSTTVFYTAPVVNTPKQIESDVFSQRRILHDLLIDREYREEHPRMMRLMKKASALRDRRLNPDHCRGPAAEKAQEDYLASRDRLVRLGGLIKDPSSLVVIDESDRLKMVSLELVRDLFDRWGMGFVLIGMPGIEKRLARYPQLYSRVGFVHEFRTLPEAETRRLLHARWLPRGVSLPAQGITDEESFAAVLRVTGGNFRLLNRLLAQIARVLEINSLDKVTVDVIEAARESLVIGAAA